jgi:lipid-binding SYLF domain-containing protein
MRGKILSLVVVTLLLSVTAWIVPVRAAEPTKTVIDATYVLKEIVAIPEKGLPPALLEDAYGIAIIPGVIKAAFVFGGRYGTGVLMVRDREKGWSSPSFVSLGSGSFGWQIGAESTDVILVFKSRKSIEGIRRGKFTLGADASVAAGPVGRNAAAATDIQLKAEIFSYSRSRGLFAGVAVDGAVLKIDDDENETFYGKKEVSAGEIFDGRVTSSAPEVKKLQDLLREYAVKSR